MRDDYGWDYPTDNPRGPVKNHYFVVRDKLDRHTQHSLCLRHHDRWVSIMNPTSGKTPNEKDQCKGCREQFIKTYGTRPDYGDASDSNNV